MRKINEGDFSMLYLCHPEQMKYPVLKKKKRKKKERKDYHVSHTQKQ